LPEILLNLCFATAHACRLENANAYRHENANALMILPGILAHSDYMQHLTIGQTKKLGLISKKSIETASKSEQITIRKRILALQLLKPFGNFSFVWKLIQVQGGMNVFHSCICTNSRKR